MLKSSAKNPSNCGKSPKKFFWNLKESVPLLVRWFSTERSIGEPTSYSSSSKSTIFDLLHLTNGLVCSQAKAYLTDFACIILFRKIIEGDGKKSVLIGFQFTHLDLVELISLSNRSINYSGRITDLHKESLLLMNNMFLLYRKFDNCRNAFFLYNSTVKIRINSLCLILLRDTSTGKLRKFFRRTLKLRQLR